MNLKDYLSKKSKAPEGATEDWLPFCTLDIKDGELWAGDPCLPNADDGCVIEVPPGKYVVEAIGLSMDDERYVSRLRVRLESAPDPDLGDEIGETGTDSAMIGVCEIAAFEAAYKKADGADLVQEAIDEQTEEGFGILKVPQFPDVIMPFVPTGSDGTGPILALMSGDEVVGIELPFMSEEEEEEEEE